ncbi:MAG: 3-deoxy-D-manno-octulosonic acid transferase [Opitutaceae bacterium]|jgi:3-deoxy-D-manno-octulosonic-acid transferase|nr:3-deoxy-D-manno-octulosonic acid transferase [Opitutaceae bacterium]
MIWAYRLLFAALALFWAPYYLWRMRRRGGYAAGFAERFGRLPPLPEKRGKRVWLQAVSVGELLAAAPLLDALRARGVEVYLTVTTSTARQLVAEKFAGRVTGAGYFPLDWWPFSARAWRGLRPDLVVLMEGERWPEHLRQAARRGVPSLVVNARLSDRSFRRMRRVPSVSRWLLRGVTRMLAASERDAERLRGLGFPAERLEVTGNLKLDVTPAELTAGEAAALREELGFGGGAAGDAILLGSSTWEGEEEALVRTFLAMRAAGCRARLLVVPRHGERRAALTRLFDASGLRWHLRSRGAAPGEMEACVADTTGELRRLTCLARLVFVGKSLPPFQHEGQSPVEAAALGKPILFGPGMTNFKAIADGLAGAGAARVVADAGALERAALELWRDNAALERMAAAARAWHRVNQGATERTLRVILEMLGNPAAPAV